MKISDLTYNPPKFFSQEGQKTQGKDEFWRYLKQELKEVDGSQKLAVKRLEDFASGKDPDIANLTLSLTKADLSFRLLLQVRNKILQAYEEIMRMQL